MARRKQDFFDIESNILEEWCKHLSEEINGSNNATERDVLKHYLKQFSLRLSKLQPEVADAA